ncbi:TPA: protein-tyrosine-phosphatase, partial [Patescibacteria group bacterium]|nr:protein-tyrosine-phosphatase [Candidatus Gracilibacteria bacterium]
MKVLFVCTGNIFRSMSAEYIMKKYIQDHNLNEIVVSSAGTVAHEESPLPWIVERL